MLYNNFKLYFLVFITLVLVNCSEYKSDQSVREKLDKKQVNSIRIAMMQPPRTGLSPLSDDAFKLSRWSTAETLINLNDQSIAEPMLATNWEQVSPLKWRFSIREGVKFHDNSILDAKTVVNSLQKALKAAPKPRILDGIEWKISLIDDLTFEIQTTFQDPLLPNRLSSPQLAILSKKAYKDDGRVIPIESGTGPFILTHINGKMSARLKRFDDYWGEKAKISDILVEYVPDGLSRAVALRTDRADVVEAIPVSQLVMIDSSKMHEILMPRTNTLYLNTKSKVFSKIALRKAASQAINADQIINMVYENHADLAQGLLGPALSWADPIRKNKPILDNIEECYPKGEKITIGTFTARAELPEVAILLKQQLEAVGFLVELDIREYSLIEKDALNGKFDAFLLSRSTVLDSGDPVSYMQSDFGCNGSFNLSQFCSEDVDMALRHADNQSVTELRQQAIIDAENKIIEKYIAIPLLHERVIQGEGGRVKNVKRDFRERRLIDQFTQLVVE